MNNLVQFVEDTIQRSKIQLTVNLLYPCKECIRTADSSCSVCVPPMCRIPCVYSLDISFCLRSVLRFLNR